MADRKIDYDKLIEMMARRQSKADMARVLGVHPSTITRAVERIRTVREKQAAKNSVVTVSATDRYEGMQFRVFEEFMKGFSALNRFIDALEAYFYGGDRTAFAEMQRKIESKSVEGDDSGKKKRKAGKKSRVEQKIERFDFSIDPKILWLRAQELREKQVMDAYEMVNSIIDLDQLRSFLQHLIKIMQRMSPGSENEIQEALKQHEIVRCLLSSGSADQGDLRN